MCNTTHPLTGGHVDVLGGLPLPSRKLHDAVLFTQLCEHDLLNPVNTVTADRAEWFSSVCEQVSVARAANNN